MKTPPVQQKQVAHSQNESLGSESEGKSLAAPAFQLKASEGQSQPLQLQPAPQGPAGAKQNPPPPDPRIITASQANLRSGPPSFAVLAPLIPKGTRVDVLEEQTVGGKTYILVKDHDTGAELGWTSKGNTAAEIHKQYANAKPRYVYNVGGFDLLVFVPEGGPKKSNPDIFMFFHGWGGNYKTSDTHPTGKDEYSDNPAISGKIPDAVAKMGGIAICPQSHQFHADKDWGAIKAGTYKSMVDLTLLRLSNDLDRADKPLTAGNISIAGHSGGGNALGQAAQDTGATDVTLMEAGYGYDDSWVKLRDWFLTGKAPKTMRVITKNNSKGKGESTRKLLKSGAAFSTKQIVSYSEELVAKKKLEGKVRVEEFTGEGNVEPGGILLERGFRVFNKDNSLQGSLRLYQMADGKDDHWAVASKTMETSMTSGATDRAADLAAKK